MTYLVDRQRWSAPPISDGTGRRGPSMGGVDVAAPMTLMPGIEDDKSRYPGTAFDGQVRRDRTPYYQAQRYIPPPVTWISWTAAGPWQPSLHMRNSTYRLMQGNSASRFPVVPTSPTTGMHTMMPGQGGRRTQQRYVRTPQMVPARYNRLAASQYAGQTYSQITRPQGR